MSLLSRPSGVRAASHSGRAPRASLVVRRAGEQQQLGIPVTFETENGQETTVMAMPGENIGVVAERAGVEWITYGCHQGNCGLCEVLNFTPLLQS